ncbi:hypothetical protein ACIBG5_17065 [Kribbella sp. NPDC050241]|uniref:hypothetical protein n=1 Tax=Kribbella sp. NPDC050241 TaxID=3364115 RepID=UPI003788D8AE
MAWQLWVAIALAATGVVILVAWRMRHAQHVFDDIIRIDRSAESSQSDPSGDELAQARARRIPPQSPPRRKHG